MRQYESYKCPVCGNEIEVQNVGGGTLVCCGKEMECITDNLTAVNLGKAFAGESMARNKYEYFAKVAQKEGLRDIAAHFQRAANNEKQHAKMELRLQNKMLHDLESGFGDTKANLQIAIDGESYENTTMYPDFSAVAKAEGYKDAASLFKNIGKVEVEHEKMYRALLARLEAGEEFMSEDGDEAWICEVCGHIHYGKKPPKVCPVCAHDQEYFSRFNTQK